MAQVEYKSIVEVSTGQLQIEVEGNGGGEIKLTWTSPGKPDISQAMTVKDGERLRDLLRTGISSYERSLLV